MPEIAVVESTVKCSFVYKGLETRRNGHAIQCRIAVIAVESAIKCSFV